MLAAGVVACCRLHAAPVVTIDSCAIRDASCGHIVRALDPRARPGGTLHIAFILFKHRQADKRAAGTIVAMEGGPGYPSSGARAGYLDLFGPLLAQYDLLLIDQRGTGNSSPIDCRELQTIPTPTPQVVGRCGRSLGAAADLYGSPLAADDFAAVLDALGIGRIDLYGESYGTFLAQVFAERHPDRLHSLILDGAYPTHGETGYFARTPAAIRRNIDLVCDRSPACAAIPGSSMDRLRELLQQVRRQPLAGRAPDTSGRIVPVALTAESIGTILYDATYDPVNWGELDAATRAALGGHDDLPLLRLAAETLAHDDSRDPSGNPHYFSYGLAAGVMCMDYPQIYEMTKPPAERRAERDAALVHENATDPGLYAPLTIGEWVGLPLDYGLLNLCLDWPVAAPPYPPGEPVPPGTTLPGVPTLILSGELDSTTPPSDADLAAKDFPAARHLIFANSFHVDAVDDEDDCAGPLVRRFIRTLDAGDAACAGRIAPVRLVGKFSRRVADVSPAEGTGIPKHDRAVAAAVVEAAGDVLDRTWRADGDKAAGLRGGTITLARAGSTVRARLAAVRWVEDLAVSGDLVWDRHAGNVTAELSAADDDGTRTRWEISWNSKRPDERVSIRELGNQLPSPSAWMAVP